MGIKLNITRKDNEIKYDFPTAYLKIYDVEIRISSDDVRIYLNVYADEDSRKLEGFSINKIMEKVKFSEFKNYIGELTPDGLKSAAYSYLKSKFPTKYFGLDV